MTLRKAMLFLGVMALAVSAYAGKPQGKWHHLGKPLHAKAAKIKNAKKKDQFCTAQCKKKGAKKREDLGACKETCTFG